MPLMEKTQKDFCLREHGREERQSRSQTERKTHPGRVLNLGPPVSQAWSYRATLSTLRQLGVFH